MTKVYVETEGQADILAAMKALRVGALFNVKAAVQETAEMVESKAKARVPTAGGETRRSIRIIYRGGGLSATVGTGYYVARFLHFGTQAHRIKTKRHKALEFEVGGEAMVRGSVDHPGIPANPFLFNSYEEERPRYVERVRAGLEKAGRDAAR